MAQVNQPAPKADPVVAPKAAPQKPKGPIIEYFGEGAEKVKFTINPKASHYKVYADGSVVETL